MKTYRVKMSPAALADIDHLSDFLVSIMSIEGSWRYKEVMRQEVQSLSIFAGVYQPSRSVVFGAFTRKPAGCFPITVSGTTFSIYRTTWWCGSDSAVESDFGMILRADTRETWR